MSTEGTAAQRPAPVTLVLEFLGAVAGIGALMAFVGGAMLWVRFDALQLPADQAVTLLPKQLLLVVGAHSLAIPVATGVLAALVFLLLNAQDPQHAHMPRRWVAFAVIVVPSVVIAFAFVSDYDVWPQWLITIGALALGVGALAATLATSPNPRALPWTVLAVFALCGAVVAVMRTVGAPTMEPVGVLLKGAPTGIGGFYIGQTSDRVYVAPLPGTGDPGDPLADAVIDRVIEIDRDAVLQLSLREPTGVRADEAGREQAQSLLEDLRALVAGAPSPARQPIVTGDPVTAFAPLVHLHSREELWPISADTFLKNSWLGWAHDDGCPDWVPGDKHLEAPRQDAKAKGEFDVSRLAGPAPYAHAPADADCGDAAKPVVAASDHSRPYDKHRPPGLSRREGFYLDLDDRFRGGTRRVRHESAQDVFGPSPVYYERVEESTPDGPGLRITYWLFYGLSRPPGSAVATRYLVHEGDWERVSVLLARGKDPGQYLPVSVRYHAHDGSRDLPWSAVKRVGAAGALEATHAVVFSARGSHASYWRAGRYENVFVAAGRRRFAVFDSAVACPKCPQWHTWEQLVDARVQPWYGFGGAWGAVGSDMGFTGPLGPSTYKTEGRSPSPEVTVRRSLTPASIPDQG
jgi:hypothetical protein